MPNYDKIYQIFYGNFKAISFIDLFCGVGGIRLGLEKAGFKCLFSSDINLECQKTYFNNFNEMPRGDISKIDNSEIPKHDILCAGFPCQPFSAAGKQLGFEDTRGLYFLKFVELLRIKVLKSCFWKM